MYPYEEEILIQRKIIVSKCIFFCSYDFCFALCFKEYIQEKNITITYRKELSLTIDKIRG